MSGACDLYLLLECGDSVGTVDRGFARLRLSCLCHVCREVCRDLLKIVVPDISRYDSVYKRLIRAVDLLDVSSAFAMETIKCTTALPLDYVA